MSPTADCKTRPDIDSRQAERLAAQLTSMVPPEAAAAHVRLPSPRTLWRHLGLTAVNNPGHVLCVPRFKSLNIARWIIRSFPQASWAVSGGHAFDLRTAQMHGPGA